MLSLGIFPGKTYIYIYIYIYIYLQQISGNVAEETGLLLPSDFVSQLQF